MMMGGEQEQLGNIELQKKKCVSHPLLYERTVEERLYQTSIAKTALGKNTLVILPTALGKTVISALVAVETLLNYRDLRVLVMAPTRPLVMQHWRSFKTLIRLPEERFVMLTGKAPADYRASIWSSSQYRLVFATPEVVRNDIREGRLASLNDFGLVVFDECHRSVKEYAYTEVAEEYAKSSPFPLILGMTASPGSDIKKITNVCDSLRIEHVEQRTDEDPDVKPFINAITVEAREVDLPLAYQPVRAILRGMLDRRISMLRSRGYLGSKSAPFVSRMDLIDLGFKLRYRAELSMEEERGPLYYAISLQSQALTLFHMIELLDTQGAYTLRSFMLRLDEESRTKKSHSAIVNEQAYGDLRELLGIEKAVGPCYVEHPKLEELKKIASDQIASNSKSRLLVFAQFRDTTTHLVEELNKVKGVRAERFVGQASKTRDKGLSQDQQASLIEDLRKGYINTLCSTSIAEEGLDIPEVDLVVFYEPIPSEIRYIQRRGRTGRRSIGKVIILAARNTNDIIYLHASERRTEKMRKIIETLNQKLLKPFLGVRTRPPPNPMTKEELLELEKLVPRKEETGTYEQIVAEIEDTRLDIKAFDRSILRCEHAIYMRILESGMEGLNEEQLYDEMKELDERFQKEIVRAALHRLARRNYLSIGGGDPNETAERRKDSKRVGATSKEPGVVTLAATRAIPGSKLMEIEIEKVTQGQAVVVVDQKWHARLMASDYNGPRELIKKRTRFRAFCELDNSSDVLCVRVRKVVQTL